MIKNFNWYKTSQEDWYSVETAFSTKNPEILTKILRKGNNDLISQYAVINPDCPPDILDEVIRRGKDDVVSRNAVSNPNCPSETLASVLKREKDDSISHYASRNPNCPPKARLDWYEITGRLTKYDPEIHELEKIPIDKDLEELRKLMGNNNNWYKTAQEEDWYNEEIAKNTENPEILAKILRKGNDYRISWYAAKNPNCHPEVLAEVLRRGKDDVVSSCAAINSNCLPDVLAEILRRNRNDNVSYHAALNPNCPPEALAEVLRRRNDDCVSGAATRNSNALPKDILEWYEATGQLTKYDPEKHELEHVEEDKDLEELRKLMGKNNNDFPIIVISAKDVDISKINRAYDYFKNVFDDTKVQDSNSHLQHIIESNKFNIKELRKFMLMVKKLLHENSVTLDFVENF